MSSATASSAGSMEEEDGWAWAVTVNVGSGPGGSAARAAGMAGWAREAMHTRRPAVVFAQEVSEPWLDLWRPHYDVVLGVPRGWRIRSALLVRDDLDIAPLAAEDWPSLNYHGDYLAAAHWRTRSSGEVTLVSVHASPQEADPQRYGRPGPDVPARHGGDDLRYPAQRLWDSDLVLETVRGLGAAGPLLAAGDLNEARDFDLLQGRRVGSWGQEYFQRVDEAGLRDLTWDRWGEEKATRGGLQLDHVLHNDRAAALLDGPAAPELDAAWQGDCSGLSDHRPIWFSLRLT
jgi:hypothetical protein